MDSHSHSPSPASLHFDLSFTQVKHLEFKPSFAGTLFVRFYLSGSAPKKQRIKLNSKEISATSKSGLFWNEILSLGCSGTQESITTLKQQKLGVELRLRNTKSIINIRGSSQVIATTEIPWIDVFESPDMEIEKWVSMDAVKNTCVVKDLKPPTLKLGIKLHHVPVNLVLTNDDTLRLKKFDDDHEHCGCTKSGGGCCQDTFALLAAFDGI